MTVNIYEMLQTWNNAGVTFDAIKMSVTDTASQADSRVLDLNVGGVRQFYVQKDGDTGITGDLLVDTVRSANATDFNLFSNTTSLARFGTAETYVSDALILSSDPENQTVLAGLYGSANAIDIRNATNPQTVSLYGTYSGGGSNYERLTFDFDAGVPVIDTASAGTGLARDLRIDRAGVARQTFGATDITMHDDVLPNADLSHSLGGGSNRWVQIFAATLAIAGQSLTGSQADAAVDIATTWNTTGTPSAILLNVTDTASNAASNLLDLQVGGVTQFDVSKSGAAHALGALRSDTELNINGDVRLQRDGANILALANGTTAQNLNIYNTVSGGGVNYERLGLYFSGNNAFVETNQGGTGVARDLYVRRGASGGLQFANGIIYHFDDLLPGADNTYDLGASGSSYVDLWMDGSIVFADRADHSQTPAVGLHQLWVRTSDNALVFTDEAGTDTNLLAGGGGGDLWSDPVDSDILSDVTNTRDLGSSVNLFAETWSTNVFTDRIYGDGGTTDANIQFSADSMVLNNGTQSMVSINDGTTDIRIPNDWTYGFSSTTNATGTADVKLFRDAAAVLALRNGATNQEIRVYDSDDGTQTNYERGFLRFGTQEFRVGVESGGTGAARNLELWAYAERKVVFEGSNTKWLDPQLPLTNNSISSGSTSAAWSYVGTYGMAITDAADHPVTPATGFGQVWVRSSDNALVYTDEAATDLTLAPGGSTGAIQYNNAGAWAASLLNQGTNTVNQENGTNGQTFNLYNTTDGVPTNYERGYVRWSVDNNLEIGTEAGGTGTNRGMRLQSLGGTKIYVGSPTSVYADLTAGTDDTEELGEVARRWGQAHISKGITFGDVTDHTETPTTGLHQLWVRTSDNKPIFTDEAGTDYDLTAGGAGGDLWSDPVDAVITPDANNTRDLGTTGTRFKDGYFAGNVYAQEIYGPSGEGNIRFDSTGMTLYHDFASIFDLVDDANAHASLPSDFYFGWSATTAAAGTPDVKLYRDAANILAQRNSTNAQEFRVYNTDDGTQTNTEYAEYRWAGNSFFMGTAAAGTGLDRTYYLTYGGGNRIRISGNIEFYANCQPRVGSNINLGSAGNEWDSIWTKEGLVFVDIADHPETPTTGVHQLWVRTSDNSLIFTDEAGTDTDLLAAGAGGDLWSDPVDAVITPDADGTRDLATTATRFATGYFDALDITNDVDVNGSLFVKGGASPALAVSKTSAGSFWQGFSVLNSGMANGNFTQFLFGKAASTGECCEFNYVWNSTANDRYFDLGFFQRRVFGATWDGASRIHGGLTIGSTRSGAPTGLQTSGLLVDDGGIELTAGDVTVTAGDLVFDEKADHAFTPVAGSGSLWLKNTTPNTLIFTDDAGTDHDLTAGGGGGDLWSDPIDSSMTVDTDSTYNLGTDAARLLNLYTDLAFVNFEMQFGQTTQDITLQRQTAQMLAIHDDTNAMRVKVYNTTDGTFTNTEYADIGWISNELYIGTAKEGTGSARNFSLRRNGSNVLRFGNSVTTTYNSILPNGGNTDLGQMGGTHYRNIAVDEISMAEKADHTNTPTAGQGLIWVRNDSDASTLIYTGDDGSDVEVGAGGTRQGTEKTIATGSITLQHGGLYAVDTEADAATDNLDNISGGAAGMIVHIQAANTGRTVVVRNNQGTGTSNIRRNAGNKSISAVDDIVSLIHNGTEWVVFSSS